MNQLYRATGITKQGAGQYAGRLKVFNEKTLALLGKAEELRKHHPGCGVEKMYYALKPDFMGRDRFIETFMDLGFRLGKGKNYRKTTYGAVTSYPNLIKGMEIKCPSMVWQSDITYIHTGERFYYAVFIIDVYTKKIVGHQVSSHMRATANSRALEMALASHNPPLVHHSDRGSQYSSAEYTEMLKRNGTAISMSLSAQDNAYAERINRTIKEEYLDHWKPGTFEQLKKCVNKAVYHYNHKRPHNSLNKSAPAEFEKKWINKQLDPVPVLTIFDNEVLTLKPVNTI